MTPISLALLSDTHGMHARMEHAIPEADVLIHAGDFCGRGRRSEVQEFAAWMGSLPHRHKIAIPGNHDRPVEESPAWAKEVFAESGIVLLLHESTKIGEISFFGSPYTPTFINWHFMRDRGTEIAAEWREIPEETDVVITHGPPYGHGDLAPAWRTGFARHVGCVELLKRLLSVRPRLHIFGHIHDGYGITISDEIPGTIFANASICTEDYCPSNRPLLLELKR